MRVALVSSIVPFVQGGARNIVEWLEIVLREAGHDVERVYLPHVDAPDLLFRQAAAFRWVDLASADRIICFRPPAHYLRHPRKVLWFIHHIRSFYDLWDSPYRTFPGDAKHVGIRQALHAADTAALHEAHAVFTNSQVVADRLLGFNGVRGEVLYPPIFRAERFRCDSFDGEVVSVCRVVRHKRQHLLVDAMRFTKSDVKLRLYGASTDPSYAVELRNQIRDAGVGDRVTFDDRWISEQEKVDALANCLAMAYAPVDEDSYGYPTLEAAHASKATLTTNDAGGVLEFVENGVTGLVVEPDAEAVAEAMDTLFSNRKVAQSLGTRANERIDGMRINWPHVINRLLA